jgi:hypothetical protein
MFCFEFRTRTKTKEKEKTELFLKVKRKMDQLRFYHKDSLTRPVRQPQPEKKKKLRNPIKLPKGILIKKHM